MVDIPITIENITTGAIIDHVLSLREGDDIMQVNLRTLADSQFITSTFFDLTEPHRLHTQ